MITREQVLMDFDVSIHRHGEKIVFYDANKEFIPGEDRVTVKSLDSGYEVYIERRTSREDISFEENEETAIIWGLLTYLRRFKNIIDQKKSNLILDYGEQDDQESISQIMNEVSDYVMTDRVGKVISYTGKEERYTIVYDDVVLCEDIDKKRLNSILFNYASLLKFIDMFTSEYSEYLKAAEIDVDEAKRFFVTRKR